MCNAIKVCECNRWGWATSLPFGEALKKNIHRLTPVALWRICAWTHPIIKILLTAPPIQQAYCKILILHKSWSSKKCYRHMSAECKETAIHLNSWQHVIGLRPQLKLWPRFCAHMSIPWWSVRVSVCTSSDKRVPVHPAWCKWGSRGVARCKWGSRGVDKHTHGAAEEGTNTPRNGPMMAVIYWNAMPV